MLMKPALTFLLASLLSVSPVFAAQPEEVDEFAMTLEENIDYPRISPRKAKPVCEAMAQLRKKLADRKYAATLERDGQVVCVTIPAAELFRANSRTLSPEGRKRLEELGRYVAHREQFKVLVAVHSDDTGDTAYSDDLTSERANAIDDYFTETLGREPYLIPYGIGRDEPLHSNTTLINRASNRRVEIFFVPTIAYIKHLT